MSTKIVNKVPLLCHLQKRMYIVFHEPKRYGKSRHRAPLLVIHNMALNISLLSVGGSPVFAFEIKFFILFYLKLASFAILSFQTRSKRFVN